MAFDHGDLDDIGGEVGLEALVADFERGAVPEGQDQAGFHPDYRRGVLSRFGRRDEACGSHRAGLHRGEADGIDDLTCRKALGGYEAAAGNDVGDGAILEAVEERNVGTPAGSEETAIGEPEDARCRMAGCPINVVQRPALGDQPPDGIVEVTFFSDIERIAVIGAERHEA